MQCMDGVEAAQTLQRLLVTEALLKVVAKGKAAASIVRLMAKAIRDMLGAKLEQAKDEDMAPIMKVACKEVLLVANALSVLCGETVPKPLEPLDELAASKTGPPHIVKKSLQQTPYWADQEKRARQRAVAMMTLVPEMDKISGDIQSSKLDWSGFAVVAKRLVVWRTGLDEGALTVWKRNEANLCGWF